MNNVGDQNKNCEQRTIKFDKEKCEIMQQMEYTGETS
jgi:hypothetical protein